MTDRHARKKLSWLPPVLVATFVLGLALYWVQLLAGYDGMRQEARVNTTRMASQSAHALALQVNTLFRKLDYFSQQLSTIWLEGDEALFDRSVQTAMQSLPTHAFFQAAVTDSQGQVVYSRLEGTQIDVRAKQPVTIADRAHFQAQALSSQSFFYIGEPVRARISNQWMIPLTRGLWKDGKFSGVLVMAVSADHLADGLVAAFPQHEDVALVVRNDGVYLTHSHGHGVALGSSVQEGHDFTQDYGLDRGSYEISQDVDGMARQYAWWRGPDYPFVVSVGHAERQALATVEQAIQNSIQQNLISSVVVLLALLLVSWLWRVRQQQTEQLLRVQQRLELALKGGSLIVWDWDLRTGRLDLDQRWANKFEKSLTRPIYSLEDWLSNIHPDDADRVRTECNLALVKGNNVLLDLEYRIIHKDGCPRWVSDRSQVVERDESGDAIRMVGVIQDITQRKEARLAESELRQRLSKLVAGVPGAVIQFRRGADGSYSFPFVSPGIERIYGISPEQVFVSPWSIFDMLLDQDRERVLQSIEESAATLKDWRAQFRVQHANGEVRWVSGHTRPEPQKDGSVIWYGYVQDVTAELEVAQALKDNEAQLRLTLQAVHDGLWAFDHRTQTITLDERIRSVLGYDGEDWASPDWEKLLALMHPQDRDRLSVQAKGLLTDQARDVLWMDFRLKTSDGQWLWVQVRARVVEWDELGLPARTVGVLTDISRQVAEYQLRQALLDRSPAAIVLMNQERQVIEANARFRALFVPPESSLKWMSLQDIYVGSTQTEVFGQAETQIRRRGRWRADVELRMTSGATGWFDVQGVLQDASDPKSPVIWTMIDISARLAADQALRTERQRLRMLMERFPAGVLIEDDEQNIIFVNERWCDLMALDIQPHGLTEMTRAKVHALIGERRAQWHEQSAQLISEGARGVLEVQDEDGQYFEIECLDVKQTHEQLGTVWFVWDITARKRHENQLNRWATTDALTSLPNRRSFISVFENYVNAAEGEGRQNNGVVIMLDIDHFKKVNDSYGHSVGDMVLKQLAKTMREQLRDQDCVARVGGEEFALLLPDVTLSRGLRIAERIRQHVQQSSLTHGDTVIQITVSLGVAVVEGRDLDELLKRADKALYRAKQTGRNKVCVWEGDAW